MVAAEDERQRTAPHGVRDEPREAVAEVEDLAEIAGVLVAHVRGLDNRGDDVARVGHAHAQLLGELLLETRIADRRRTHIDAPPPGAEVERRADHGDLAGSLLDAHGAEANGKVARAGLEPATPRFSAECSTS